MASLGVSVVITLGCGKPPSAPAPSPSPTTFSVLSMFPAEGLRVGGTVARIAGTGFQAGDTVTVDRETANKMLATGVAEKTDARNFA